MRSFAIAIGTGASLLLLAVAHAAPPETPGIPSYVVAAITDPARLQDAKIDARRHGAELAAFARVKPGDVVVDLIPGAGYFTRIFSKIVGPAGHVYALWPQEYAREAVDDVAAMRRLARDPGYANITVIVQPAAAFAVPQKLDVMWTSQNYHDYPDKFMGPTDPRLLDQAVFQALKPGGVFVVVDHRAEPGSGLRDTERLHRIDAAVVKEQVTAAGFMLEAETDMLKNAADTHTLLVFDPKIRGHTDQFAFRFRKPK